VLGSERQILSDYIKTHKIDLIHAHFADVGWLYSFLAKKLKIPFVVSFYGWDYEQLPYLRPRYEKYFKKLFAMASAIVCEGPHGIETLVKAGCPREKLKIVRLGVEVEKIPFYKRSKKVGELKLVQLATFNEKKGHIYSVMAYEHALVSCPNMHLTLAGGKGPEKEKVTEYIKSRGLESKVDVLDHIEWKIRHEFLKDFHVFIHPSCYAKDMDCEGGAPVVILEAQASGMPVISTFHCDIPNEVVHRKSGILVPEKNVEDLSETIRFFYETGQQEYDSFSNAGLEHVQTNFNVLENQITLLEVYRFATKR
jgi:colanic acid/amylovoran biosynthesis glycosyltransferase